MADANGIPPNELSEDDFKKIADAISAQQERLDAKARKEAGGQ
jgi:hypothetical protein